MLDVKKLSNFFLFITTGKGTFILTNANKARLSQRTMPAAPSARERLLWIKLHV